MSKFVIKKEDIDKIKESIFNQLLDNIPQHIIDHIAEKVDTRVIVNDVLTSIPKPIDGKDGKDAEITEEIISRISVGVLKEARELIKDGKDGKDGRQGQKGDQGFPGRDGKDGESIVGPMGPQGPRGLQGLKGDQGQRGIDGKDGKDGKQGPPGKSISMDEVKFPEVDLSPYATLKDIEKRFKKLISDLRLKRIQLPYGTGDGWLTGVPLVKEINKSVSHINPLLNYMHEETAIGDEGINITGELHVGTYDNGKESVFGQGDSHTNGMVVFSTPDGGTTFIDNTVAAASGAGSVFQTFGGGIGINAADYIGSDMPLCGVKFLVASLVNPGPTGTVAREYWNGSMWTAFKAMATDSDYPYDQRADNIGTKIGSEQVRFGDCENQVKTTVNGVEKYWVRLRITSPIVSNGTIEQVKLHTNRFEINADGFTEYFGSAVYPKDLLVHWQLTQELVGFSPLNEPITFAGGITLQYVGNRLKDGQNSGRGGVIEIPEGLDTSKPLQGELTFIPLTNSGGDVVLEGLLYQTRDGDTLSASNIAAIDSNVLTIPPNSANKLIKARSTQDVENLVPGEYLVFGVKRLGADVRDTYVGDIAVIGIRSVGFFWKP